MRVGQHVQWKSVVPGSERVFAGIIRCLEHALNGWAVVEDEVTRRWNPVKRERLVAVAWNKGKTAKGGGDDSAPSGVLMAEVA